MYRLLASNRSQLIFTSNTPAVRGSGVVWVSFEHGWCYCCCTCRVLNSADRGRRRGFCLSGFVDWTGVYLVLNQQGLHWKSVKTSSVHVGGMMMGNARGGQVSKDTCCCCVFCCGFRRLVVYVHVQGSFHPPSYSSRSFFASRTFPHVFRFCSCWLSRTTCMPGCTLSPHALCSVAKPLLGVCYTCTSYITAAPCFIPSTPLCHHKSDVCRPFRVLTRGTTRQTVAKKRVIEHQLHALHGKVELAKREGKEEDGAKLVRGETSGAFFY